MRSHAPTGVLLDWILQSAGSRLMSASRMTPALKKLLNPQTRWPAHCGRTRFKSSIIGVAGSPTLKRRPPNFHASSTYPPVVLIRSASVEPIGVRQPPQYRSVWLPCFRLPTYISGCISNCGGTSVMSAVDSLLKQTEACQWEVAESDA